MALLTQRLEPANSFMLSVTNVGVRHLTDSGKKRSNYRYRESRNNQSGCRVSVAGKSNIGCEASVSIVENIMSLWVQCGFGDGACKIRVSLIHDLALPWSIGISFWYQSVDYRYVRNDFL